MEELVIKLEKRDELSLALLRSLIIGKVIADKVVNRR